MEEKKSLLLWVKENKKRLVVAGVSITAIVGIILGIKNRKSIMEFWTTLQRVLEKYPVSGAEVKHFAEDVSLMVSDAIEAVQTSKSMVVNNSTISRMSCEVSKHIRNLHEGWHPSAEKIATAANNGIHLLPGQTWVEAYTKGGFVA